MKRLSSADRTCDLILGVGDGKVCVFCVQAVDILCLLVHVY